MTHHPPVAALISRLRAAVLRDGECCERAHVVYIDRARRFCGEAGFGPGSTASLVLDPRTILADGFRLGAHGMILAHNHPSGDCRPSRADREATHRLVWVGRMVDLYVLDHLIVTPLAVYSMRQGGLL